MSKYLFVLLGLGGTAGVAATAISFGGSSRNVEERTTTHETSNTVSSENEARREEESRPEAISSGQQERQELHPESEQKLGFKGKLVFNKGNKDSQPGSRLLNLIYKGQILTNDEYEKELEKWQKEDEEEGEQDTDNHITVTFSSKNNETDLKEYLKELNEKIFKQPGSNHLEKLKTSLESDKQNFEENFGKGSYDEFLKAIKKNNLFD